MPQPVSLSRPQSRYTLVDAGLIEHLDDSSERKQWLFLEPHPDFEGQWTVEGFSRSFLFDLKDQMGPERSVAPSTLAEFLDASEDGGYKVAFFEDPASILDAYADLAVPPPFQINSSLENTVNGLLPFQVQGFNKLKDLDGGVARWDTGTGKSILAFSLIQYHLIQDTFDLCFFCVKKNNKVNIQRKLQQLAGVKSILISGSKDRRERLYTEILDRLAMGETGIVVILNYEKFRDDFMTFVKRRRNRKLVEVPDALTEWGQGLIVGRRIMALWDEMPMKLKTRTTKLYGAICHCLYDTDAPKVDWAKRRPSQLRQYMLSATPIENDPEDWFNTLRLLQPDLYGSVAKFRDEYVASYDYWDPTKPSSWRKLDKMGAVADHIVHDVDKSDPKIATTFPDTLEDDRYIDWEDKQRRVYDRLEDLALELKETEDQVHILSLINLLQMMCDCPTMVLNSAAQRELYEASLDEWEENGGGGKPPERNGSEAALTLVKGLADEMEISDKGHSKLEELRYLLQEKYPGVKTCIFSSWNECLHPMLMEYLDDWRISYVRYNGTTKQMQAAQDAFQQDPEIQVFLSSDAGSDSIDLPEAQVVIDYNLPWKWVTRIQRRNRAHRATSKHKTVYFHSLLMADSVEDRKLRIIERKRGYHEGVFGGMNSSASARMTAADLSYILGG